MTVRYVGFWARVLAFVVDSLLVAVIVSPVAYAIYGAAYFDFTDTRLVKGRADVLLQYVFPAIAVLLFWIYRSATPGKLILKAKIVDADTLEKPEPWQWVVRYLGYYVSMFTLFIGFAWVAFDMRKQGFHDKLGRTVVIYDDTAADDPPAPENPSWEEPRAGEPRAGEPRENS